MSLILNNRLFSQENRTKKNANNKVGDIKRLVKNTSKIIGSVLKSLIQRSRDFLLDKIIDTFFSMFVGDDSLLIKIVILI